MSWFTSRTVALPAISFIKVNHVLLLFFVFLTSIVDRLSRDGIVLIRGVPTENEFVKKVVFQLFYFVSNFHNNHELLFYDMSINVFECLIFILGL